jgi:hypothetical protein
MKISLLCTISSAYETNIISLTLTMPHSTLTRKTSDLSWCVYPTDYGRLDNASYTTSVTSSVLDYRYVNVVEICVQWLLIIADMKCVTSLLDHELCWSDTERSQISFISWRRIYSGTWPCRHLILYLRLIFKQPNDERERRIALIW